MPFKTFRWLFALFIVVCYTVRVVLLQGWYIVSYALAIYLLNLFVAFISPKIDPAFEDDEETGESFRELGHLVGTCNCTPPP